MTDADFLAEILARPDDDAPRLIYADWLEERGEPRGELIRLQCETARLPRDSARYRKLRSRELELIKKHGKDWTGSFAKLVRAFEWGRGFVEWIKLSTRDLLSRQQEIFAAMPVQKLYLTAGPKRMADLAACPFLSQIRSLEFAGCRMGDEGCVQLLASPHLGRLTDLLIYAIKIGEAGLRAVVDAPVLKAVTTLGIGFNPGIGKSIATLARAAWFDRLIKMDLRDCGIAGESLSGLFSFPGPLAVQTLTLARNPLGADGGKALAKASCLANLTTLDLGHCDLRSGGLQALAAATGLQSVTTLDLQSNGIDNAGFSALAGSSAFPALEFLDLSSSQWTYGDDSLDDGVEALAQSPLLAQLSELRLAYNNISARAVEALAASPHFTGKTVLDLRNLALSPREVKVLQDRLGPKFGQLHKQKYFRA